MMPGLIEAALRHRWLVLVLAAGWYSIQTGPGGLVSA